MKLLLLLVQLLCTGVLAQNITPMSTWSVNGNVFMTLEGFVFGTDFEQIINVTGTWQRNLSVAPQAPFQWIAIAWANPQIPSCGSMIPGLDTFYCDKMGNMHRAWLTSTVGIPQAISKGLDQLWPNGSCWNSTNGSMVYAGMNLQRDTQCYFSTTCMNHTYGTSLMISNNGPFAGSSYGPHITPDVGYWFLSEGVATPTPPTIAHTPMPTGTPTPPTVQSPTTAPTPLAGGIPGYAASNQKSFQLYNPPSGAIIQLAWQVNGNTSVRFAIQAQGVGWLAVGFQTLNSATPPAPVDGLMNGEAIIFRTGDTVPSSYKTIYQCVPNPNPNGTQPGLYWDNFTSSNVGGLFFFQFDRPTEPNTPNAIPITDLTAVGLMVSEGPAWPIQHENRAYLTLNLLTGASSGGGARTPPTQDMIAAIIIIAICCALGLIFQIGLGHTTLGRWCYFKRICKDSQFLGKRASCACFDLTWGQTLLTLTYFGLIALVSRLAFGQETAGLRFLRCMGWTSTISVALASVPVSRQSIILYFFGMSFERAILFHRIAARTAVLIVLMHFVAILLEPSYQPLILSTPLIGDFKITLQYGFWAYMCMLLMFVTSLPWIRRSAFEVFYYIHHAHWAVWVLAILHNQTPLHQGIIAFPVAWYGVDLLIRFYRGRLRSAKLEKATIVADALRLEFKGKITSCMPPVSTESGSYAFLHCPGVSWFQWHPFSISSRADAENFTFHIKNMGKGTFTGRLHEYFSKNPNGKIYVDGPYGHCAVRWEEYSSIVLVCGGIGVTPMVAILDDLYEKTKNGKKPPRLESVIFAWTIQTKDSVQWFDDVLKKIRATEVTGVRFDIRIYVSKEKADSDYFRAGRPKYDEIFDAAQRPKDGAGKEWNIGVLCCGPDPMVHDVQTLSQHRDVDFHKEIFAF